MMDSFSSDESLVYEGVRFSLEVEVIPSPKYDDSSDSDTSICSDDSYTSHDSGISGGYQLDSGTESDSEGDDELLPIPFLLEEEDVFFSVCLECGEMIQEFEADMGGGAEAIRLVNRLKNTNLEKFHSMCKMHLSFLLDLPGPALEDFLGEPALELPQDTYKSRSIFNFGKKKAHKENKHPGSGIFGAPLCQEILDAVFPILEYLEKPENVCQEGLFRKSGHIGRQKILREKLNAGEDIQIELDKGVYSAHDCAGVLKTFLGELPEPLLTEKYYMAHCQVPDMLLDEKQTQTAQLLVQLLPPEHATLLQCLLHLLHLVSQQDSSKMTADTLGTLFAPHLLVPKKMTASEFQSKATNIKRSVSFMIDRSPILFCVPERLVRDIATYWEEMEEGGDSRPGSAQAADDTDSVTCRHRYRKRVDPSGVLINTKVSFADRQASLEAAAHIDQEEEVAKLYAQVASMPESAYKRKMLKRFNKTKGGVCSPIRTPADKPKTGGHKRSRSLGESLKKMVGRNHKRRGSGHAIQVHNIGENIKGPHSLPTPQHHTPVIRPAVRSATPAAATPVMRLFKSELQQQNSILPSSPRVHIVDLQEKGSPVSGKRKQPGMDSPIPAPSTPRGSASSLGKPATPSNEEQENRETPVPGSDVGRLRKYAKSSILSPPEGKYQKHSAFISPITRSIHKASKSVKNSMMTPGSRVPMAMIQTP